MHCSAFGASHWLRGKIVGIGFYGVKDLEFEGIPTTHEW